MVNEFKLIVAGGRDFNNYALLSRVLFAMADVELADREVSIVSGMARGADALGVKFALDNNVRLYKFPANWDRHGKAAGFIRNHAMGDVSDGLLAFWDGQSKGTNDMIQYMQSKSKLVTIVNYNHPHPLRLSLHPLLEIDMTIDTMKRILIASNYDDEMFTESFLNTPPMDHLKAQLICDALNGIDAQGSNYYKPVNVDYIPTFFTP